MAFEVHQHGALGADQLHLAPRRPVHHVEVDRADHARTEADERLTHVVGLDLQIAEGADHRGDRGDGAAEPLHPVEGVALVKEHAAALVLLRHVEGAIVLVGMPAGQVDPGEAPRGDEAAGAAGREQLLRLLQWLEEAHAESGHRDELLLFHQVEQLRDAVEGVRDRLLHEEVEAPAGQRERRVHVIGGGQADEAHPVLLRGERGLERWVERDARVLGRDLGAPVLPGLDDRGGAPGGEEVAQVPLADGAAADDESGDHDWSMSSVMGGGARPGPRG